MVKIFEKWWRGNTRTFSVIWYPRHFFRCFLRMHNNGTVKGKDRCYEILDIRFNYVNWRYDE